MKRRKDECIGSLIKQYLREEGLESPLNEFRLLSSWALVMGNGVERQTGKLYIKNEVLFVEIKSATLRADSAWQSAQHREAGGRRAGDGRSGHDMAAGPAAPRR